MTAEKSVASEVPPDEALSGKPLSPAAKRALAEAAERRALAEKQATTEAPKELNGRDGPDPVRFGDWESRGIASDF